MALSERDVDIVRQQYELVTRGSRGLVPRTWSDDTILVVHEGSLDSGTYVGSLPDRMVPAGGGTWTPTLMQRPPA